MQALRSSHFTERVGVFNALDDAGNPTISCSGLTRHTTFCFVVFFHMKILFAFVVSSDDHVPVSGDHAFISRKKSHLS